MALKNAWKIKMGPKTQNIMLILNSLMQALKESYYNKLYAKTYANLSVSLMHLFQGFC
jgi:hypothetical protein